MLTDDAWSIKSAKIDERMIQVGLNEGRTLDVVHKEATSRSDFIGYDLASASANDSNPNAGASLSPPNYLVPNLRKTSRSTFLYMVTRSLTLKSRWIRSLVALEALALSQFKTATLLDYFHPPTDSAGRWLMSLKLRRRSSSWLD